MAAKKDSKLKESDYIKLVNDLNAQIESAYKAIKVLSDNYKNLMAGDKEGPYWNGAAACTFYKTAKSNLDNAIIAYGDSYSAWDKLMRHYANLCKSAFKK